jgi:putative restriction endonuclease
VKGLVAPTDFDWYQKLSAIEDLDEVNFWQPAGHRPLRSLAAGDPFFFKLKRPYDAIGGFGYYVESSAFPAITAWEAFGMKNGVNSYAELLERCIRYRRILKKPDLEPGQDPEIGCIRIIRPIFFQRPEWISQPTDWHKNTIGPKLYDLQRGEGLRIWSEVTQRGLAFIDVEQATPRFGAPRLVLPRLGQGTFRLGVIDAYGRACSITEEHSLPVLEAAHIKPFCDGGPQLVRNGLLFRADIHKLFDAGYVTVTPKGVFRVSSRLRKDWSNGRTYYPLDGKQVRFPKHADQHPDPEMLQWHNAQVFKPTGS